jgi:mannobiose 2-epimerase
MKQQLQNLASELETELKSNILSWWMVQSPDHKNGGYVGHVNLKNRIVENASKGSILNARILWTFSAAYNMFRNGEYLEYANRAYEYILDHFLDPVHGGVFWEIDYTGRVLNPKNQIYALAFMVYAMTEYYLVTSEKHALETAKGLFELIERNSLDPQRNGYREAFGRDWKSIDDLRLSEKDLNSSKTMNTHLHILEAYTNLYRAWNCAETEKALENIIRLFIEEFIDPHTHHLQLFFDDEWNLKSDLISYGHDIECSWLLYEAAELLGYKELTSKAQLISVDIARQSFTGLDRDHGLFYEYFPSENRIDTDKHWWPQAEAMVGYLNAYQLSGEDIFARKALDSWEFIKYYLIDHKEGEWFLKVNRKGLPYPGDEKAGFWKCPYHNGRACLEIIKRTSKHFY